MTTDPLAAPVLSIGTEMLDAQGNIVDFKHNQFGKFKRAYLPSNSMDELVKYLDDLDLEWIEPGVGPSQETNYRRRKGEIAWVDDETVNKYLWGHFVAANEDPDWKFDIDSLEPVQYSKYSPSDTPEDANYLMALPDHYEWHNDTLVSMAQKEEDRKCRKLSMTLVLTDGYDGGDFECGSLRDGNISSQRLTLEKGEVIIFPSIMEHRVLPVLSGERRVLVAWAWGPLFK